MSVSLRGNLEDFGIADVFQLIGQQRKTGVLEFSGDGEKIQLLFDRGAVVSAAPVGQWTYAALGGMLLRCGWLTRGRLDEVREECEASAQTLPAIAIERGWLSAEEVRQIEDLLTRETIFSVLRWQAGSFDFTAGEAEHDREFDSLLGAEQILMDGLRMVDEWQSFAALVPSDDLVFRRILSFEQYRESADGEASRHLESSERVFELIDGRLSVRRVVDLSMLGTFDAVRALGRLIAGGVVEAVDSASLAALESEESVPPVQPPRLGKIAAVAVPLALVLVASMFLQWSVRDVSPDAFAIRRPGALERVRSNYAQRRLRNAIESHWFIHGRWPSALEELERDGLVGEAMASEMGPHYYYANHADGAWLLAPDR